MDYIAYKDIYQGRGIKSKTKYLFRAILNIIDSIKKIYRDIDKIRLVERYLESLKQTMLVALYISEF